MKSFKSALMTKAAIAAVMLSACSPNANDTVNAPAQEKTITTSGGVNVSAQDKRKYAYKTLPNGLKVIVVSDPDADKAAASLDVHIGHMADPADREGLTHFLEHMLFLGTKKYPEVGEYQKFISKNGGSNNAGTGQEHTSYYFQIDNGALEPALDRFSRFFIDPLFDPKYVDKERNAVNSEYSLKVKDDARRYREALKQTGNQAYPASQFSVGNLDTLSDSEVSTIYDAVKAQYDKYYSADIMALSVLGNYPTEQLMAWAEAKFADVPSKGDTRDKNRAEPFLPEQKGVKITINTLEDKRTLALHFALPPAKEHFKSKPIRYIQTLLGHEGDGTLFEVLKSKNYLKNMYASTWSPDDYTHMNVYFELTNEGYDNIDEVTDYFFSYVEKIKQDGVNEAVFNEMAGLANLNFEFQDKFRISSYAGMITGNLQYYPPEHALDVRRVYDTFDPDLIRSYLNGLKPETMRMIVSTPDFNGEQREARYDVAYKMESIATEKIEKWKQHDYLGAVSLPAPNPYIAKDLDAKNTPMITTPEIAVDKPGLKLWYVNENEFDLPKSNLNVRLYAKNARNSDAHRIALMLHRRIISDLLNSESYPASEAGLYFGVSTNDRAYNIGVQGYNDKIDTFLASVLEQTDPGKVTQDVFDRIRKNFEQDIMNRAFARPISQAFTAYRIELNPIAMDNEEQLTALAALDLETFKSLITEIQSELQIEGLYNGNISKADTAKIGDILRGRFKSALTTDAKLPVDQLSITEGGSVWTRQINVDHADSTLVWSFQGDDSSIETRAKARLIHQMLRPRFFKSIRTDQQYGYVVNMFTNTRDDRPYVGFYAQSPKAHPSILKAKFQEYMDGEVDYLANISDEEFGDHVDGLLSNINKKYDNVYAKGNALHSDLIGENYDFDTRADLTAAIKTLTKTDMLAYYKEEFLSDKRRSLMVWNIGKAHQGESTYDPAAYNICTDKHCVLSKYQ